jgi:hypothetical protein
MGTIWVYKTKENADGTIAKFKARIVVLGNQQVYGESYTESHAPVVHISAVRVMFVEALQRGWGIDHKDVKGAYLNGVLQEEVYVEMPEGYRQPGKVWRLQKALYGLKQAGKVWNENVSRFMASQGYKCVSVEQCMFVHLSPEGELDGLVVLWVDDLLSSGTERQRKRIDRELKRRYQMTDLGPVTWYVGIKVEYDMERGEITLSQPSYVQKLLEQFEMLDCKPRATPMEGSDPDLLQEAYAEEKKVSSEDGEVRKQYRTLVGALLYLANSTRPDIEQAVTRLCRYVEWPTRIHLDAAKRVLRYLSGTKSYGLVYLRRAEPKLVGFADASWAEKSLDTLYDGLPVHERG